MSNRIRFARNSSGDFDFSESRLARFNATLRPRVGQAGPLLPVTFMNAACGELIRAAHRLADTRNVGFLEAAGRVVRERPELFWLTRGQAVNDGDAAADVEIDA